MPADDGDGDRPPSSAFGSGEAARRGSRETGLNEAAATIEEPWEEPTGDGCCLKSAAIGDGAEPRATRIGGRGLGATLIGGISLGVTLIVEGISLGTLAAGKGTMRLSSEEDEVLCWLADGAVPSIAAIAARWSGESLDAMRSGRPPIIGEHLSIPTMVEFSHRWMEVLCNFSNKCSLRPA